MANCGTRGSILTPKYESEHEALHQSRMRKCRSVMVSLALNALIDVMYRQFGKAARRFRIADFAQMASTVKESLWFDSYMWCGVKDVDYSMCLQGRYVRCQAYASGPMSVPEASHDKHLHILIFQCIDSLSLRIKYILFSILNED